MAITTSLPELIGWFLTLMITIYMANFNRLMLALISLSWSAPHSGHSHFLSPKFLNTEFVYPHSEHSWLDAKFLSATMISYHILYLKSSITTTWFSFISLVDNLFRKPALLSAIF